MVNEDPFEIFAALLRIWHKALVLRTCKLVYSSKLEAVVLCASQLSLIVSCLFGKARPHPRHHCFSDNDLEVCKTQVLAVLFEYLSKARLGKALWQSFVVRVLEIDAAVAASIGAAVTPPSEVH